MSGQISRQINTAEGPLMVYVVKRIAPDEKVLQQELKRFTEMYTRGKTFAVNDSFNSWIARNVSDYMQAKN